MASARRRCGGGFNRSSAACNDHTASWPPRLRPTSTGFNAKIRRSTLFRLGAGSPRTRQVPAMSRCTVASVRFCRVKNCFRRSRTRPSTSSERREVPLPPEERPGAKSVSKPDPSQWRLINTYTWRRDIPSEAATPSTAALPMMVCDANGAIAAEIDFVRSHTMFGMVNVPDSAMGTDSASTPLSPC